MVKTEGITLMKKLPKELQGEFRIKKQHFWENFED